MDGLVLISVKKIEYVLQRDPTKRTLVPTKCTYDTEIAVGLLVIFVLRV